MQSGQVSKLGISFCSRVSGRALKTLFLRPGGAPKTLALGPGWLPNLRLWARGALPYLSKPAVCCGWPSAPEGPVQKPAGHCSTQNFVFGGPGGLPKPCFEAWEGSQNLGARGGSHLEARWGSHSEALLRLQES